MAAEQSLKDLQVLFYSTKPLLKRILTTASDILIEAISELALNVLHNEKIGIEPVDVIKLKKFKKFLSVLANPHETLARKKFIIKNNASSFLPLLLQLTLAHVPGNGAGSSGTMETDEAATTNSAATSAAAITASTTDGSTASNYINSDRRRTGRITRKRTDKLTAKKLSSSG